MQKYFAGFDGGKKAMLLLKKVGGVLYYGARWNFFSRYERRYSRSYGKPFVRNELARLPLLAELELLLKTKAKK